MIALTFAVLIFSFASMIGISAILILRSSEVEARDVLLAPALGFSGIILLVVPLNTLGLPVNVFAWPLALMLFVAAGFVLVRRRMSLPSPIRKCTRFAMILLGALILTASPMWSFGLSWFSFSNGDAVSYSFSAERLRIEGLYTAPNPSTFLTDKNPVEDYYFLNGLAPSERYGVDELLAFIAANSRIDAFRCLMPLIVALYLALICAVAALAWRGSNPATTATVAATAFALSALGTLGVVYQLLGQTAGLIFLTAGVAVACRDELFKGLRVYASAGVILTAMLFSALAEAYPELLTFAILTVVLYHGFSKSAALIAYVRRFSAATLLSLLFLNVYVVNVFDVTISRLKVGASGSENYLFPFYLLPSGFANLFGLTAIADFPGDPWISLAIAGGMALFIVAIVATIRSIRLREPGGYLCLLFLLSFLVFLRNQSGFGLYKLAMYLQPSLIIVCSSLVVASVLNARFIRLRPLICASTAVAVLLSLRTQQEYVSASRAAVHSTSASFIEIPNVSDSRVFDRLRAVRAHLDGANIVSDTFNIELARIEGFFTRNKATISFPLGDEWPLAFKPASNPNVVLYDPARFKRGVELAVERSRRFVARRFTLGTLRTDFVADKQENTRDSQLWFHGPEQSPFNRSRIKPNGVFEVNPGSNLLAFVSSSLGVPYYLKGTETLFQLEPDLYYRNSTMDGVGRYLLFEVINPQKPVRFRLALTETLRQDGRNVIPPVAILGRKRVLFPVYGRGGADVISGPVDPQVIGGHSYVLLDMGTPPTGFVTRRPGLMKLWGKHVETDRRLLTGFLRDFSVVDSATLGEPPDEIKRFPQDLQPPRVVYSGIYEDGWASEDFMTRLKANGTRVVHLRGLVPNINDPNFSSEVSVRVDGFEISNVRVDVGDVVIPVMLTSGDHEIEWRFSRFQRLPGDDRRPVSMLIRSID